MPPKGYHAFKIEIETVLKGDSYEDALKEAIALGDRLWNEIMDPACIVVREHDSQGPDGVFCEGCEMHTIGGVRWPTSPDGRTDHEYVERCDRCQRFASDEEALERVREVYAGHGTEILYGECDGHLWIEVN